LRPGEFVQWANGGSFYFGRVVTVGAFTKSAVSYNCAIKDFDVAYPAIGSSTINAMSVPILQVIKGDTGLTLDISPDHYTRSYVATSYGNAEVRVAFDSNFEFYYGCSALDPNSDVVRFVAIPTSSSLVGAVAQRILEAAGLTVNAASVTTFDAALGLKALLTIPNVGESDYRTYREYLQDLLGSCGAYLRINTDEEVEIKLLAAPDPTVSITDRELLPGSFGLTLDSGDIAYELEPSNPHIPTPSATENSGSDSPNTVANSTSAQMLHRGSRSIVFPHCLETITDRIAYLLSLRSSPRRLFQFAVATELCDFEVGDDVTLTSDLVPGGSAELKISGLSVSTDQISVKGVVIP
jgi:hypothetical protein